LLYILPCLYLYIYLYLYLYPYNDPLPLPIFTLLCLSLSISPARVMQQIMASKIGVRQLRFLALPEHQAEQLHQVILVKLHDRATERCHRCLKREAARGGGFSRGAAGARFRRWLPEGEGLAEGRPGLGRGPVGARPEIVDFGGLGGPGATGDPLRSTGPAPQTICTKNLPRRPILREFRGRGPLKRYRGSLTRPWGPLKEPRDPFKGPRGPFKGTRCPLKGPRGPFKKPKGP